eukprot:CAMPEP_0180193624 /NCGR_PEP_ID=MMETSP0987-20121128/2612_1 /TAXON_ID=697907 /ORGANISM="non described non described, Strain CCMP2293" /LENGTH=59 /DNA_ID=CAMNT_0022148329 /DNA_START=27 /DNA_END=207 /DNA_ORIENTATION=-
MAGARQDPGVEEALRSEKQLREKMQTMLNDTQLGLKLAPSAVPLNLTGIIPTARSARKK